jgi:hypothetical protein
VINNNSAAIMSNENEKEPTKADIDTIEVARVDSDSDIASAENGQTAQEEPRRPMATKRALIAWLVLCFSVYQSISST